MSKLSKVFFATSTDMSATLKNEDNILLEYDFNDKRNADNRIQLWDDRKGKDGKTRYFLFVGRDVTTLFEYATKVKRNADKGIFSAGIVSKGREVKIVATPERATAILRWLAKVDTENNVVRSMRTFKTTEERDKAFKNALRGVYKDTTSTPTEKSATAPKKATKQDATA